MSTYYWTADSVGPTASELGYDPQNFADFMNEQEAYDKVFFAERSKMEMERLIYLRDLAKEKGITSAYSIYHKEITDRLAWSAWRADPENNPFPGC